MKLTKHRRGWEITLISVVTALLGCTDSKKPVATVPLAADPSTSFNRVVENLRHYLDELQVEPMTAIENGGFSDFRLSREVISHEITPPPAGADDDYRGSITVATRWSHSFRPPPEQPTESPEGRDDSEKAAEEQSAEETIRDGIQVLDSEVIADLRPSAKQGVSPISPSMMGKNESEEDLRKFQFVYRNNLWELADEPIAEAEVPAEGDAPAQDATGQDAVKAMPSYTSLNNAVIRALKLQ